jgi:hypothetical protein
MTRGHGKVSRHFRRLELDHHAASVARAASATDSPRCGSASRGVDGFSFAIQRAKFSRAVMGDPEQGSFGSCTLIEAEDQKLFIDAGFRRER